MRNKILLLVFLLLWYSCASQQETQAHKYDTVTRRYVDMDTEELHEVTQQYDDEVTILTDILLEDGDTVYKQHVAYTKNRSVMTLPGDTSADYMLVIVSVNNQPAHIGRIPNDVTKVVEYIQKVCILCSENERATLLEAIDTGFAMFVVNKSNGAISLQDLKSISE